MKKIKLLLSMIVIMSVLALTGCGEKDPAETDATTDETTTTETSEASGTTDTGDATEAIELIEIDYSAGLDDEGLLDGITALDYTELPDYMNISIPNDVHTVTEEIVQSEIDSLLAYFTTTEQVTDRAVVDGDTLNIDYVGSVDGVEFEGGSTGGAGTEVTIGVTSYIDDFLAQLIGHTPGESFDIEVTFPAEYGKEELNGKDAVFAITINHINEAIIPELNDQFVSDNFAADYQWTTVEEMTSDIEVQIRKSKINTFLQEFLIENATVTEAPQEAITFQEDVMLNYYKGSANQYGMGLEEYLAAAIQIPTVEDLMNASAEQTLEAANFTMIIQAIAEDADLSITEDYITEYFLENAGTSETAPFIEQYGIGYIKNSLLQESVMTLLSDNAELE